MMEDVALYYREAKKALLGDLISWGILSVIVLAICFIALGNGFEIMFSNANTLVDYLKVIGGLVLECVVGILMTGVPVFGFRFFFTKVRVYIFSLGSFVGIVLTIMSFLAVVVIGGVIYMFYRVIKDSIEFHRAKKLLYEYFAYQNETCIAE